MLTWVVFFCVCTRSEKNRSCWGYSRRRIWKLNRSDSMKRDRNERCSEESKNFRRLRRSKLWTRLLLSRKQLWGQRLWKTWQRRWCVFFIYYSCDALSLEWWLVKVNRRKEFPRDKSKQMEAISEGKKDNNLGEYFDFSFLLLLSLWKKKSKTIQSIKSFLTTIQHALPTLHTTL